MDGETGAITLLRRLARAREPEERCELCATAIGAGHRHLLEMSKGRIVCACDGCALAFQDVVGGRFKLIPRDTRWLRDFEMSDADWGMIGLPINLAFIVRGAEAERVRAFYPSPGGATESLVPVESLRGLVARNPILETLQRDTEALLVNRVGEARDYFAAPVDVCYELVGLVRKHWRGFSGGDEVWEKIGGFFAQLKERSEQVGVARQEAVHA